MDRRRRCGEVLSIIAATTLVGVALGNPDRGLPQLHEDLFIPKAERVQKPQSRPNSEFAVVGPRPQEHQNPTAIESQNRLIPAPQATSSIDSREPTYGRNEFGADRETNLEPDYSTEADPTLDYGAVFSPSILPFKRMSAMNSVRENYSLYSQSTGNTVLRIGDPPRPAHDLFWGSITAALSPDTLVPIPSVSPNMRIVSYEATPKIRLQFSKDDSDNYYVRLDEPGPGGTYRIIFVVESSRSYFVPQIPPRVKVREIPKNLVPALPGAVIDVANKILGQMGLHRDMSVHAALDKLVYYFRSFDAKSPPKQSGDIYWDLSTSQAGVCRHRSFAFMITANALGVPTRYVTNEAHAWVEVWVPTSEWIRIDLGGVASTLRVDNARDTVLFEPPGTDPFGKPKSFLDSYSRLEGDILGVPHHQLTGPQLRSGATTTDDVSAVPNSASTRVPQQVPDTAPDDNKKRARAPDQSGAPPADLASTAKTFVRLISANSNGYRGEAIAVSGAIVDSHDNGIQGLRIDVWVTPEGTPRKNAVRIGSGITNAKGQVSINASLPLQLKVAQYELFVSTPGNLHYKPSTSEYNMTPGHQ